MVSGQTRTSLLDVRGNWKHNMFKPYVCEPICRAFVGTVAVRFFGFGSRLAAVPWRPFIIRDGKRQPARQTCFVVDL